MNKGKLKHVGESVAIVGMSGRFPGAENIYQFWENLRDGVESISTFSPEELIEAGIDPGSLENPNFVPAGSVIEDIELFDAAFFGFSPREAESLDPQQRIFLETAWHALEDAGYDPQTYVGSIGVYAGCAMSTYLYHLQSNPEFMALLGYLQVYIGNDKDYLASRVSYKLNLKGPSFSVQTACSTSLVAATVACGELIDRRCDMAIAGGITIRVPQKTGYYFEQGGIFSPDGHCRVFDEEAQGVVFGNGVGVVVLKQLEDALADGDSIHAIIRGWAVNNDGSGKASFTAPSIQGQAEVISLAQKRARVSPDTITYIEAHGTGTALGDPVEIAALAKAFRDRTKRKHFCAIGSVKTNIGHLDPAAGSASLIKTVLALKNRQIPASLNFETPNPAIDFANSPFYVNTRLSEWKTAAGRPRRAGVSAFGIGGTNVHLIVEEAPVEPYIESRRLHHILLLSARSGPALETVATNLTEYLEHNPVVRPCDLSYTYQVGRRAFSHRQALVFQDLDDLRSGLKGNDRRRLLTASRTPHEYSPAFMFSGQGSQYVNMALDLYRTEPTFRANFDRCSELLKDHMALDLRELVYPQSDSVDAANIRLTQTQIAQPALFLIEYSLAQLWMEWGIRPEAMVGHSIGEYVAACLADVFSLEDGLALVAERGRLMQALPGGSMLAVPLSEEKLQTRLDGQLDVAAINEPASCVVSGDTERIEELQERLLASGIQARRLHTSHAFHSRMMDPILTAFTAKVAAVALRAPRIPYISNVTGDWISAAEAMSPEYWARHIRQPVRFAEGVGRVLEEQGRILVEVGPGQALVAFARRHSNKSAGTFVLPSLRHPQEETADTAIMLNSLARLWLSGAPVDWSGFNRHEHARRIHLPVYPFERQRYWAELPGGSGDTASSTILKEPDIADWFYAPSWEYAISPQPGDLEDKACCWLIFEDTYGVGRKSAEQLRRGGYDVVSVKRAKQFAECRPDAYEIDPKQPKHYLTLLAALEDSGRLPDKIVHGWSLGPAHTTRTEMEAFDYDGNAGFFSLLYLAQALVKLKISKPLVIVAVSNNLHLITGEEQLCPGRATLLGACKSIPQEFPNITCRNLDLDIQLKDKLRIEEAAAQVISFMSEEIGDTIVAYRRGQRWVQIFEPLPLGEVLEPISMLRQFGVYLVTGGLGNIGLTLAEYLARTVRAKLVLLTRSDFPSRRLWKRWLKVHPAEEPTSIKIQRLQYIEELGSEVCLIRADVADAADMRAALKKIYTKFGALNGVIHGAGNLSSNGFFGVDEADDELCERQFQAKIRGLIVLEQVLRGKNIDFVVLLSSISSILAGLGYVAYSAGNAFMDAFAHKYTQQSGFPWISIDWDTWEFEFDPNADANPARLGMFPEEGVEAFSRILSAALLPQVVVSTGDLWARIDQWINPRNLRGFGQQQSTEPRRLHSRPELTNPYKAPTTSIERAIAEIWQETLGIAQVGILDNFFLDLSGSSLLATQVASQLRSRFQVDLPLRRLFEAPTVAELAATISAQSGGEQGTVSMEA